MKMFIWMALVLVHLTIFPSPSLSSSCSDPDDPMLFMASVECWFDVILCSANLLLEGCINHASWWREFLQHLRKRFALYSIQGGPSGWIVGLSWLWFWFLLLNHAVPGSAWMIENWQNGQNNWARWTNITNQSHPDPTIRPNYQPSTRMGGYLEKVFYRLFS